MWAKVVDQVLPEPDKNKHYIWRGNIHILALPMMLKRPIVVVAGKAFRDLSENRNRGIYLRKVR